MHIKQPMTHRLTGIDLKLIAIVCMLIDHIGAVLIERGILGAGNTEKLAQMLNTDYGRNWYLLDLGMRMIGRLAFPIFCFLLVEGFVHTCNVRRYFLNLTVFAFISEIPFDMAVQNKIISFEYQNVYFTLAMGLLILMCLKQYENRRFAKWPIIIAGCIAANLLKADYGQIGILIIVSFYLLRDNKKYRYIAVGTIAFFESIQCFGTAALALVPIRFYGGERGVLNVKYMFYWFYPVHLLVLFLLRYFVIGLKLVS